MTKLLQSDWLRGVQMGQREIKTTKIQYGGEITNVN
jgi:hypothetical protein